jgi:glycosyltransferase involved in cell wall biosynthesis
VDDGSSDDPAAALTVFPQVRMVRQPNRGLAAARNAGLHAATSEKVIFLDADDYLLPSAIEAGLECFARNAVAAFVHGAFRIVHAGGETHRFTPAHNRCDLIRCNWIAMIATVMFDRAKLVDAAGFDESLRMCEDWDAYLRLSREFSHASHPTVVACYVRHGGNMSNDVDELKRWIEVVRDMEKARGLTPAEEAAWVEGEQVWESFYPELRNDHRLTRIGRRLGQLLKPA